MPSISIISLCLCMCRIARELNLSSVMVLRKGVCSLFITLKIRSAMHVDTAGISRQSYESYIFLRDRIEVGLVKVSTMVCGFTFGSISLHLISKRKKEILTPKHQYNANYLSRFNECFQEIIIKKIYIFFSRFQLYA